MSKGVLIFAYNNADIDYAKISLFAAKRVKKYLNVPVSLVTDSKEWLLKSQPDAEHVFDKIITEYSDTTQKRKFQDGSLASKILTWKNFTRCQSYDLTPYDETLVMDSDYILCSNLLSKIWDNKINFLIYPGIGVDLALWRKNDGFEFLNQYSIPFFWATVFYFKKSLEVDSFFSILKMVRENWDYFRSLYNIDTPLFRNDYSFSIALNLMGRHFFGSLPGKMKFTLDRDLLVEIKDEHLKFLIEKENYAGEYTAAKTSNLDIHVMNKYSLIRCIDGLGL